jgi:hypothetical protein
MDPQSGCWHKRRFLPCPEVSSHMLTIPPILQDKPDNCGEAAVRAVLAFHSFAPDFLARVKISCPRDGVDPLTIERYLSTNCGLRTLAGSMSVADLRHFCNDVRPVICLVHWPDSDESHYVITRGVSRGDVWYFDVETGDDRCRIDEWERAWSASDGRRGHLFPRWGIVSWPP